jgi:hypothetical protein
MYRELPPLSLATDAAIDQDEGQRTRGLANEISVEKRRQR